MNSRQRFKLWRIPLIKMQAVVEAPYCEGDFSCPWETAKFQSFSMMPLYREMIYPKVGSVIAQLAKCNGIELNGDKQTVFSQILALENENLVLPGGIQVIDGQNTISPGCCCGLETWREWLDFLKTGKSPWLGHDPSPFVENLGNVIRIWSDGGMGQVSDAFYIDVSRDRFTRALILVEQDLQAFLFWIESWAQEVGFTESSKLCQKFDECFSVKMAI